MDSTTMGRFSNGLVAVESTVYNRRGVYSMYKQGATPEGVRGGIIVDEGTVGDDRC